MIEQVTLEGDLVTVYGDRTESQRMMSDFYSMQRPDPVRTRKPKGVLPPKPYAYTWERLQMMDTKMEFKRFGFPYDWTKVGPSGTPYLRGYTPHDASLPNRAVIKALGKLKDQRVNLGVALAEAQQTADFIGSASSRLYRSAKHMLNRDWKKAARTLRLTDDASVPNSWLEWQYAATPLLQDVKGVIDELVGLPASSWVTTVRASAESRELDNSERTSTHIGLGNSIRVKRTTDHRAYVSLSYRPQNAALASIARLGMANPAEVLWEKVPFSFVADWFLPIGDWLSAFDATVGYEFLHGSLTQFSRSRYEADPATETIAPYYRLLYVNKKGIGNGVRFTRTVYPSSPLPRPPSFKNPLSLGHMANGLSLLASFFSGKDPPKLRGGRR